MNPYLSYFLGLVNGVLIVFLGQRLIKIADKRDAQKDKIKKFKKIKSKMPKLIEEMTKDLRDPKNSDFRDFILLKNSVQVFNINRPCFRYYGDEHKNLGSKIKILVNTGYVRELTKTDSPIYQFEEEFVELITNDKI